VPKNQTYDNFDGSWQRKYNPVMVQLYKFYFEFQKNNKVILIEKRRLQTAFICMIIESRNCSGF